MTLAVVELDFFKIFPPQWKFIYDETSTSPEDWQDCLMGQAAQVIAGGRLLFHAA